MQMTAPERLDQIQSHLRSGGSVMTVTHLRSVIYGPKHLESFAVRGASLYVRRGRSWDCLDWTPVRFSRVMHA